MSQVFTSIDAFGQFGPLTHLSITSCCDIVGPCLPVDLAYKLYNLVKNWLQESSKPNPTPNHDHNISNFVNMIKSLKITNLVPKYYILAYLKNLLWIKLHLLL